MQLVTFPLESYPVLYRMYWTDELDESKRIKNDRSHNTVLSTIFNNYYNITLDLSTLDSITYVDPIQGQIIIYKVVYMNTDGSTDYIWEYFDNWVTILNLNRY